MTCRVTLPPSKSIAARLIVIALRGGYDPSYLFGDEEDLCDDLQVLLRAARILRDPSPAPKVIDLHDSGTAKRFLATLCGYTPGLTVCLRQSARLAERPLDRLQETFMACGRSRRYGKRQNKEELWIEGHEYVGFGLPMSMDTSKSSQGCSAQMLVSPAGESPTILSLSVNTVSSPYIEMTASLMRACGVDVSYDKAGRKVTVNPGKYKRPDPSLMEADWSSASFMYLYALLSGDKVLMPGLGSPGESLQGDSRIASLFEVLGVRTEVSDEGVLVIPDGRPSGHRIDVSLRECPDLVPPLAVACAMTGTPFLMRGISHLRFKESDRLKAVSEALGHFGLNVGIGTDSLEWNGSESPIAPLEPVPSCNDHRIAMAFSLCTLRFPSVKVDNLSCIDKSFPAFVPILRDLKVPINSL